MTSLIVSLKLKKKPLNQEYLQKHRSSVITWHRNVHRKRNSNTYHVVAMATLLAPVSSMKSQISPLATFLSGTEGLAWDRRGSHIV